MTSLMIRLLLSVMATGYIGLFWYMNVSISSDQWFRLFFHLLFGSLYLGALLTIWRFKT